jgi:hypothetical protein
MSPTRFVATLAFALSLFHAVVSRADEPTDDAASTAPNDPKRLATVPLAGPFADVEAYCATPRVEQPAARCKFQKPLAEPASRPRATGPLASPLPFDRLAVIEVTSDRSNNDWAIGLHSAAGWWVDEAAGLWVDGRGRGLPAVLDAHWEAGQWGPRVRIRLARSWWKKEESLARESDDYQCSGAVILCGQDAAGKLGCSEELMLAVTASCRDEEPTPIWPQWQRWTFRLEPEAMGRAAWRLMPHGSSAKVLGKDAPSGLQADIANILLRRGVVVQLPY